VTEECVRRRYGPEIGLILSSFARSLLASSHSLLMVLGGAGAVRIFLKMISKEKKKVKDS
jgi:hypothetical protein